MSDHIPADYIRGGLADICRHLPDVDTVITTDVPPTLTIRVGDRAVTVEQAVLEGREVWLVRDRGGAAEVLSYRTNGAERAALALHRVLGLPIPASPARFAPDP